MGALIALIDKRGENVSRVATAMLETMDHRGLDTFGIASASMTVTEGTLDELSSSAIKSDALIGHGLARILPRDEAQPVHVKGFSLAVEGRIFPTPAQGEVATAAESLARQNDGASHLLRNFDGPYAFAAARSNEIVVGRDPVGGCPLYFGESDIFLAVASERKALWRIGIEDPEPFPPGASATINEEGFRFERVRGIRQPPLQTIGMESAAQKLLGSLKDSIEDCLADAQDVAIAFSGGIDSSVIALLSKLFQARVQLIHVGLGRAKETALAQRAAEALNLPLHQATYTIDDVEEVLPRVLWLIEDPGPVNASIAVPLYWVAEQTADLGLHVLLTGQGSDEIFGGYRRYLGDYAQHGSTGLQRRLFHDVVSSHESNLQRDNKICASHKVEVRTPFTSWSVIRLALSLPPRLKIASTTDPLRKGVLRNAAKNLGLPHSLANVPKKAIQYTAGVSQAMRKLARSEGLTLREYLGKLFRESSQMMKQQWRELR